MEERSALESRKAWLPLLVTLLLMAVLGGWVTWQWKAQQNQTFLEQDQRFTLVVDEIEITLRERMRDYEVVLRGLAGLFVSHQHVTPEEWARATEQLHLQDLYPGIQALSLARYARRENVDLVLAAMRSEGRPDFRIYPVGDRDEYLIADYLHPMDWRNRRVVGFDMFSEEARREGVINARDSGVPWLTGPLRLKQETEQNTQHGVLLYLPLFRPGAPATTVEERREAFIGTMHGAFRLTDLMEGVLGARAHLLQLQLFDAQAPDSPLLADREPVADARFVRTRNIYMYGRSWQLDVASTPEYEALLDGTGSAFSFAAAMTAALLFSLLIGGYLFLRERALRNSQLLTAQLQERESRFRQLIEQLPVATLLCNQQGRIELANQSAAHLLGSSIDQLAGERVARYVPDALEPAQGQLAPGGMETQAVREDGVPVPVAVSRTSFRRDEVRYNVLNLLDLQPRKRDEERFRNVVEASPNAFVLVDIRGTIVMVNRQTELLFGYSRQELLGEPVELLLPDALREAHRELRSGYIEKPEPRRMGGNRELFGRHRDGRALPVEIGLSPLRSGDELLVQAVIIDISHRKAAERRLRDQADQLVIANRYKSEFLANMSHELRTPLNSILILSDQLGLNASGNLNEKQVRHAHIINRAGNDLLQLINDVLDLAKIEAGHMQLKLEPVDLRELLVEVQAGFAPMAEQQGLALTTQVDSSVPATVVSDRARLVQVLRNLVSNALKFTEQGEVSIEVGTTAAEGGAGAHLLVRVCDTGIGIAEDQHERIFQAFQQIDGSISRQYGGTGLGLAIVRQLADVLGGKVTLESAPGEGSCFIVELPMDYAPAEPLITTRPAAGKGRGSSLLIVEDDEDFASVLAEVGQAHGFSSRVCTTGQDGLDALVRERFAAAIIDILLPDVSGWQVHHAIRADSRHQDMPVYIISCVPQPHSWAEDGSRYLVKPVQRADLERLFGELSEQSENPQRLLLVEQDPQRRATVQQHLQAHGFQVVACAGGEDARQALAERSFGALVIDFDLPGENGIELLEGLERLRPLLGVTVVMTSQEPMDENNLQRLRRFSAVTLSKHEGLEQMEMALKAPVSEAETSAFRANESPLLGRRVLLVDEDVRTLYGLSALLDEQGLQVVPASRASEALKRFGEDAFDLAMIDMGLSEQGAPELIRQLREDFGCQVPIVALSKLDGAEERQRCAEGGADDCLHKPVDSESLQAVLHRWLGSEADAAADQ